MGALGRFGALVFSALCCFGALGESVGSVGSVRCICSVECLWSLECISSVVCIRSVGSVAFFWSVGFDVSVPCIWYVGSVGRIWYFVRVVSVRFSGLLGILGLFAGLDGFGLPCALGFLSAMGLLVEFVLLGALCVLGALALFGGRGDVEKGGLDNTRGNLKILGFLKCNCRHSAGILVEKEELNPYFSASIIVVCGLLLPHSRPFLSGFERFKEKKLSNDWGRATASPLAPPPWQCPCVLVVGALHLFLLGALGLLGCWACLPC